MSALSPVPRRTLAETCADRLRSAILEGELPAGERLPAEQQLADQLEVSRLTLRSALIRLAGEGLVEARVGTRDKRERHLHLTPAGADLERDLSEVQRERMRGAYREAGPEAVRGFRMVLEAMMDPDMRRHFNRLKEPEE